MVSLPEQSFRGEVLVKKVMGQMGGKGQGRMVHAEETVWSTAGWSIGISSLYP